MQKKFPELDREPALEPAAGRVRGRAGRRAEDVNAIARSLRAAAAPGVEKVKYGKQTADRILRVARVIEIVFLVAVLVLLSPRRC